VVSKLKKTISWLFEAPAANAIPSIRILDNIASFLSRIFIIIVRIVLRISIGKKKRETIKFYHKLHQRTNISFSFYFFMFLYKVIRVLRIGNPSLIKIYVPKYNYKVYCPATEQDYVLMTEREDDLLEHFRPNKNDIVIDVGAYLGRYTFICSNRIGESGKVIAIEANPIVFEKLKKNIDLNQSTNITCLNYAVYSEKSKKKLFLREQSIDTIYSPHNTVMVGRDKLTHNRSKEGRFVNIDANTLDDITYSTGIKPEDIKWIKIDVEGAEYEVLKGAKDILSKSKELKILIEVHHLEENKNLYQDIMEILKTYNFKIKFEKVHESGERHIIVQKQQ
jgi:FkbM family methyltransferase